MVVMVQCIEYNAVKCSGAVGCSVVDAMKLNSVEQRGCSTVTCSGVVVVVQRSEYLQRSSDRGAA